MFRTKYTEEDVKWAESVIEKLKATNEFTYHGVGKYLNEYEKRFNRRISQVGFQTWLRRIDNPEAQREYDKRYWEKRKLRPMNKKEKISTNVLKLLEQSKYILCIFDAGVFGFDTKEQVKEYLTKIQSQVPIKLFENIPAEIKVNIEIVM